MTDDSFAWTCGDPRPRAAEDRGPVIDDADPAKVRRFSTSFWTTQIVCGAVPPPCDLGGRDHLAAQVPGEFTAHAEVERGHPLRAAERISQPGGDPDFDPATLAAAPTRPSPMTT